MTGREWLVQFPKGAYLGHHHIRDRLSYLEPHGLDVSLKRSGRAGLSSGCHWYLAGGLQMVLAFSRPRFATIHLHDGFLYVPTATLPGCASIYVRWRA
jgi:hypothetical protein